MASGSYSTLVALSSGSVTINWQTIVSVTVPIVATLIAIATYLTSRTNKREELNRLSQENVRDEIKTAVDHLAEVLLEKLESKDAVNQLRIEMARVEEQIRDLKAYAISTGTTPSGM